MMRLKNNFLIQFDSFPIRIKNSMFLQPCLWSFRPTWRRNDMSNPLRVVYPKEFINNKMRFVWLNKKNVECSFKASNYTPCFHFRFYLVENFYALLSFVIASSLLKHVWKYPLAVSSLITKRRHPGRFRTSKTFKEKLLLFINWKSVKVYKEKR